MDKMNPPESITQAVRSMRTGPPPPIMRTPTPSPPPEPFTARNAPSPEIRPAPQPLPVSGNSSASASELSSGSKSITGTSVSGDSASLVSDMEVPLNYQQPQQPLAEPPLPQQSQEWSYERWMPLGVAALTFVTIFSAGPLLLPTRLTKVEDGKPDKAKWALAAGSCACSVFVLIHAYQMFA